MNKVELEAKVDSLQDEINFLRAVYEAVSKMNHTIALSCWFISVINIMKNSLMYLTLMVKMQNTNQHCTLLTLLLFIYDKNILCRNSMSSRDRSRTLQSLWR